MVLCPSPRAAISSWRRRRPNTFWRISARPMAIRLGWWLVQPPSRRTVGWSCSKISWITTILTHGRSTSFPPSLAFVPERMPSRTFQNHWRIFWPKRLQSLLWPIPAAGFRFYWMFFHVWTTLILQRFRMRKSG